ncbi:MAG: right-handed parallel beta-helix repeat-containing protein [Pseudomonadota bacterium]
MNIAVTDGVILTPPAFVDGLDVWSSEDGTPGQATYEGASNAALVSSDSDFGPCLELTKTQSLQQLRYMGETPLPSGTYLEVKVRLKAVAGAFPSVRIAGWAGSAGGVNISGATQTGGTVALDTYGRVVEVSAIVGSGQRVGVDMPWGPTALYGHFGLDLTGPTGGIVRIEDISISDVTGYFLRDMIDVVDVMDYGAVPDGLTDNVDAFEAADADANGRDILVPDGLYYLGSTVTLSNPIRFEGKLSMPKSAQLLLTRSFDFPTYADAFGDEEIGLQKALQAMFNFTDHDTLDLKGRRIEISAPIDVQDAVNNKSEFATRRVIRNGQINCKSSSNWDDDVVVKAARYVTSSAYKLTNISNAEDIAVGSLITGSGVGREVYVTSVNAAAGEVSLNDALYGASGNQNYTFTRHKFAFDLSGFSKLQRFVISHVDLHCQGNCSGIALSTGGLANQIQDCTFTRPKDRAIASFSGGCAGLQIDRCQFYSNESELDSEDRTTICFNINSNDAKIRDNRAIRFRHFGILSGTGIMISNNHFFSDDNVAAGTRTAGLVFTRKNLKSTVIGNYIDNCYIDITNEHDAEPDWNNTFSFGGISITGNIFTASDVANWFSWIQITPFGSDHFINGLTITDNVFKIADGGNVDRAERVDTGFADLDHTKCYNFLMDGNTFYKVNNQASNPIRVEIDQSSANSTWSVDLSDRIPFGGELHHVEAFAPLGRMENGSGSLLSNMPYFDVSGSGHTELDVRWPSSTRGTVFCSVRCDAID